MTQEIAAAAASAKSSFRQITRQALKAQADTQESLKNGFLNVFRKSAQRIPEAFFHYPLLDIPTGIEEKSFKDPDHDVDIHYYVSKAKVERGVVVACTGLKEPISLSKERIQQLNDQGLSYICLRLPNSGTDSNIIELYEAYQKFFYLDPRSPVHQLFPDVVKFVEAHSTGGQGAIILATHPETAEGMKQYTKIYADAPFLDTPFSSEFDPVWQQWGYNIYANIAGDRLPENEPFGAFYLVLGDIKKGKIKVPADATNELMFAAQETKRRLDIIKKGGNAWEKEIEGEAKGLESRHRLPTSNQSLELRARPREHKRFLEKNGVPEHAPIVIYADPKDDFSSFLAAEYWANLIGAKLEPSTGIHNQLNKDDKAFAHFLGDMEQYLPAWPEPEVEAEITPEEKPEEAKGWHHTIYNFSVNAPAQIFARAASIFKWPGKKEEQIALPPAPPENINADKNVPAP